MAPKIDPQTVLRAVIPYPAVFVPNEYGGADVIFPNFAKIQVTALNVRLAAAAAREELTRQIYEILRDGQRLPRPSAPDKLPDDISEHPGTTVQMITPDKDILLKRLGLDKKPYRTAPTGEKYRP